MRSQVPTTVVVKTRPLRLHAGADQFGKGKGSRPQIQMHENKESPTQSRTNTCARTRACSRTRIHMRTLAHTQGSYKRTKKRTRAVREAKAENCPVCNIHSAAAHGPALPALPPLRPSCRRANPGQGKAQPNELLGSSRGRSCSSSAKIHRTVSVRYPYTGGGSCPLSGARTAAAAEALRLSGAVESAESRWMTFHASVRTKWPAWAARKGSPRSANSASIGAGSTP